MIQASPIEEVSNALYDKGVKFIVTHNMDLQLPELMFDGATFRITPRAIEGNGMIAKLEYIPKAEIEARSTASDVARLFKKKISEWQFELFPAACLLSRCTICREIFPKEDRTCALSHHFDHQND